MDAPPGPLQVSGGAGGFLANRDVIVGLAAAYGDAAAWLVEVWLTLRQILVELATGGTVFGADAARGDPLGQAQAVAAVSAVVEVVDAASEHALLLRRRLAVAALGYPWGSDLVDDVLGPSLGSRCITLAGGAGEFAVDVARHGTDAPQRYLVDHPGAVDAAVHASGPLAVGPAGPYVGAFLGYRALVEDLDGHGHAVAAGTVTGAAPRSLADLASDLAQRDTGPGGSIDVRIITGADGSRHVVVDVTGIDTVLPAPAGHDPADLVACARAINGRSTAYEQGVLDAMRQAGVRPGDPVMIIGHSLGGMIAVNTARDAVRTGRYRVTHVVTEGSPVGRILGGLPPSVQALAIENRHDIVPHLDGRPNPATPNVTTVTAAAGDRRTISGDHDSGTVYVPLARSVDASTDTSVRSFLRSAHGFLSGATVTTHTYRVVRS